MHDHSYSSWFSFRAQIQQNLTIMHSSHQEHMLTRVESVDSIQFQV